MALSRRLFLGGLLTAAAAPAIVTSKGFKAAVCGIEYSGTPYRTVWWEPAGTVTGRMNATEPAWQELSKADNLLPHQREALKRILFCQRYGTPGGSMIFDPKKREKRLIMTDLDYSRMEARAMALFIKPMA